MAALTSNLASPAAFITGGLIVEWAKYSAYGIPFSLPGGDTDSDADCDSTDITQIQTWIDAPAYDVRGDINLDGSVDSTDKSLAISNYQATTSGWNVLSAAAVVANRIGYAGYQKDINLDLSHVRNRVYSPELGRWTRRDPLGYVDGMSLYDYSSSMPVLRSDAMGLASEDCTKFIEGRNQPGELWPEECCCAKYWHVRKEEIKKKPDLGPLENAKTLCCNGKPLICANEVDADYKRWKTLEKRSKARGATPDDLQRALGLQIIWDCIIGEDGHEQQHIKDPDFAINCSGCPTGLCYGDETAPPKFSLAGSECRGYRQQLECLAHKMKNDECHQICRNIVKKEMMRVEGRMDDECGEWEKERGIEQ